MSPELVHAPLQQARTHLHSAELIRATDRSEANAAALYDAARKALVALFPGTGAAGDVQKWAPGHPRHHGGTVPQRAAPCGFPGLR